MTRPVAAMPLGTMVVTLITADRIGFLGAMGFAKTEDPEGVTLLRDWSVQGFLRPDSGPGDLATVVFGICLLWLLARGPEILSIDGLFRLIWGGDEAKKSEKKPKKT